jgi:aldehyde:ferredoxin oxidoreductase
MANRITESTREYNHREGLGPETDVLAPALHQANAQGAELTEEELARMVGEYNTIRANREG